ncbi:MAG: hypothetical protein II712_01120 [Erysipelotrichaceae bacterium]|nr:hypothetical protein [Erysipelotrichaceae bacterium]
MKVRDLVIISFCAVILFLMDELLHLLPNIQLSVFLLILFSRKCGLRSGILIVIVYVLLDSVFMGAVNPLYVTFMIIGWMNIPVLMNTVFRKVEDEFKLALVSILCALIYCWMFIIPNVIILKMDFLKYMAADLPFEALLSLSSFVSTLWLYKPCSKAWDSVFSRKLNKE